MEQLGLIKKYDGSPPYASIKKVLRLIVNDIDEKDPKDIAYVYSGYDASQRRQNTTLTIPISQPDMHHSV